MEECCDLLHEALEEARRTREARFAEYFGILAQIRVRDPGWTIGTSAVTRIVTDFASMAMIEEREMRRVHDEGRHPLHGRVGVVCCDSVSLWVNHAVVIPAFQGDVMRTWKGIYWFNGLVGFSVALIPYTEDGRVVMVPAWRGPVIGRWELEFPGGGVIGAKDAGQAVKTELLEECGFRVASEPELVGESIFYVDPSTNGTPILVYKVLVSTRLQQTPEIGEHFKEAILLDATQLSAALRQGHITLPAHPGEKFSLWDGRNGICIALAREYGLVR